jgi:hypothetical protein
MKCRFEGLATLLLMAIVPAQLPAQGGSSNQLAPAVEVTVNGLPLRRTASLTAADTIVVSNGFVSVSRTATRFDQRAGLVAYAGPLLATTAELLSLQYGDYTYVAAGVVTELTRVEVLKADADEAIVRWTFGAHRLDPKGTHEDSASAEGRYPFVKTVWLRRGVSGYWALVEPLIQLSASTTNSRYEHEIGFGGLWGPGILRLGSLRFRADTVLHTIRVVKPEQTGFAVWFRDGELVRRLLVPMPLKGFLVPAFEGEIRGGTWVLVYRPRRYGALMGFAGPTSAFDPTRWCVTATLEAPAEFRIAESERELRLRCHGPSVDR